MGNEKGGAKDKYSRDFCSDGCVLVILAQQEYHLNLDFVSILLGLSQCLESWLYYRLCIYVFYLCECFSPYMYCFHLYDTEKLKQKSRLT